MFKEVLAKTAAVAEDYLAAEKGDKGALMRSGVYTARTARPLEGERPSTPPISNLGPYTPEAAEAIDESRELVKESRQMRGDIAEAVEEAEKEEKRLHNMVNDALTQRLAETITLLVGPTTLS